MPGVIGPDPGDSAPGAASPAKWPLGTFGGRE